MVEAIMSISVKSVVCLLYTSSVLDDMYKNGDLDTRAIVTISLLNSLSDAGFQVFAERVGVELKKDLKYTRKLKGKNIKPEKKKKKKKVVAKTLDN